MTATLEPAYSVPEELVDDTLRYANVAERVGSAIVDCLSATVLCIPVFRAEAQSRAATFLWMTIVWIAWYVYAYFAYRRWGQTLGKWIFRTRLVSVSGEAASGRQILTRLATMGVTAFLILPGYWVALGRLHGGGFGDASWLTRQTILEELTPAWGDVMAGVYWLVGAAGILCVLMSRRKQAPHDMVGGTVVISLRAREPVVYVAPASRGQRALLIADWTLAALLALAAGFFLLASVGASMDTNPATAAELNAAVKPMLIFAAAFAVLAALMVNAALSLRSTSVVRRRRSHVIAYVLAMLPVALFVIGFLIS